MSNYNEKLTKELLKNRLNLLQVFIAFFCLFIIIIIIYLFNLVLLITFKSNVRPRIKSMETKTSDCFLPIFLKMFI